VEIEFAEVSLTGDREDNQDRAAHLGLGGAQFLRQSQADLEIAVIDAADFPGEEPRGRRPLATREACHAPQHSICDPGIRHWPVM